MKTKIIYGVGATLFLFAVLAMSLAPFAHAQTTVQKVGGGNNTLSNGSIVVGNNTSLTATGSGTIIATGGVASSLPWAGLTAIPSPTLSVTGDGTAAFTLLSSGVASAALTLTTVNSNIGTFAGITVNGKGLVTAATNLTITTTAPLTGGGTLGNLTFAMPAATTSVNGYLTSTDWNTFNSKQAAGNYITALTGDGTAAGPGSAVFTLAAVATGATTGSSTAIPVITFTNKGLVTAITTAAVIAPAGTLTGTTLASNVITSSLTTVGTIGSGAWQGTVVAGQYGGSGVANAGTTFTRGGNVTFSGAFGFTATLTALTALTFPTTGTLATLAGVEALTNKTINGNTFTAGTYTLTGTAGKTLTFNNSVTLAGTDGTTQTFPSTSASIARTDAPQTFTGTQTFSAIASAATLTTTIGGAGQFKVITGSDAMNAFWLGNSNFTNSTGTMLRVGYGAATGNTTVFLEALSSGFGTAGAFIEMQSSAIADIALRTKSTGKVYLGPGGNTATSNDVLLVLGKNNTGASFSAHTIEDQSTLNGSNSGSSYATIDSKASITGSFNYDHIAGFQARMQMSGSGTLTYFYGFLSEPWLTSGTVTNVYHYQVRDPLAGSTITNNVGIRIEALTRGTNNFAIQTAGAGIVSIGDITDATIGGVGSMTTAGGFYATKKIITGSTITTADPTNGAGAWLLGTARTGVALAPSTTTGIQIKIDGALYTLAVLTSNP